ncbi:ABC transporter substrate-binding protein/permease [Archangium primigenium]|uniref:ABC transporter substrate-binding protein/permease n=1 Tax=[Archangium] primigenium TaxID=2792470 RepID=UPI0019578252|nr:ABC transporter substrate-binding protein/permease [Archangium primigenium]MBM7111934.1 ABC transporter permease subunit [Archangium primigenium]
MCLGLLLVCLPALAQSEETAEAADAALPDGLAALKARGELLWGADSQGGAPYVFQDPMDPNRLVGFEVDLADALAAKLGVRARMVRGPYDSLLELLARGDFDVVLNGIEVAEEKKRVCLLTRPYYAAAERLTVRRGDKNAPHALGELKGRPVGTLPGTLAERVLRREGADVKTYDGGQDDIYADLKLGRTDAVLLDDPITQYYGAIEPELEVVPGTFGHVDYAVAVRLGDEPLREALNQALEALAREGELRRIYERWGLWNAPTAELLGDPDPVPHGVPEAWESWRAAVGKIPPFLDRVRDRYPATLGVFARGAVMTLVVSLLSMALAIAVGLALAVARVFGPPALRWPAMAFIEAVRGTPLLVQLTLVYFGLPQLGLKLAPLAAGVLTLGINYAAAEAENYRAGLSGVPAAQYEAAKVLGLSRWQTLRHIVFPQALRISLPPMTNDFIALLKDSSLVSMVTLTELTRTYLNLANSMRDHLGLGLVVAALYLLLGLPFAHLARTVEARLGQHLKGVPR